MNDSISHLKAHDMAGVKAAYTARRVKLENRKSDKPPMMLDYLNDSNQRDDTILKDFARFIVQQIPV